LNQFQNIIVIVLLLFLDNFCLKHVFEVLLNVLLVSIIEYLFEL